MLPCLWMIILSIDHHPFSELLIPSDAPPVSWLWDQCAPDKKKSKKVHWDDS